MKEIPLTKGKVAIVDDCDYEELSKYKWCAARRKDGLAYYAIRSVWGNGKNKRIFMHRVITECPQGMQVDHIDGNGLNNTRANLRNATQSQNNANSRKPKSNKSGFKGVHLHTQRKRWVAMIKINKKARYLGIFDTPELAHQAYCLAAKDLFGDFARTK